MKNSLIGVLFLIIIGLFVYNIVATNEIKTDVEKYQSSIDSIQTKIDSVSLINKELDNRLAELDTNISEITQEIELVDKFQNNGDSGVKDVVNATQEVINKVDQLDESAGTVVTNAIKYLAR